MSNNKPDLIIIRGAPGIGKSASAKHLEGHFPNGVRIEVDILRAMVIGVDWMNQDEHIRVLSASANLAVSFLRIGLGPVIVVDTFSGDKLKGYLRELKRLQESLFVRSFALVASASELQRRVEMRPANQFREMAVCQKLNTDTIKHLTEIDYLIDNTNLTAEETVTVILEQLRENQ